MPTYQDASVKTCRCKKGHLPLPRLKETALVPGCEETELAKLLTVDSCKRQFTLGAITGTPAQVPYFPQLIFNAPLFITLRISDQKIVSGSLFFQLFSTFCGQKFFFKKRKIIKSNLCNFFNADAKMFLKKF